MSFGLSSYGSYGAQSTATYIARGWGFMIDLLATVSFSWAFLMQIGTLAFIDLR
jgi:hypothetical protein